MEIVFDFRSMPDAVRRAELIEPVLACYQQVLGHDLPNRLVALQGLAVLLDGPADRLDSDGAQMLRQIAELSRGIDTWVRRVAQMGRLCREPLSDVPIDPSEVASEAAAETKMLVAGLAIDYHWEQGVPAARLPRLALHQVLVQLLRRAASSDSPGRSCRARLDGRVAPGGFEITVAGGAPLWAPSGDPEKLRELFAPERATEETRIGFWLARQLAAACAGRLRISCEPEAGNAIALFFPSC